MLTMLVSVILVIVISLLFFFLSYYKLMDMESMSSYECGFNMMSITRIFFSFRFFLICILFLIFDVEIVLMLPIPYMIFDTMANFVILIFFMILVFGLLYEYYYGSLNWLNFISKA